jgi:hypothetical protein
MSSTEEVAAATAIAFITRRRRRRNRTQWVKRWLSRRRNYGACAAIVNELQVKDPMQLRNFLRVSAVEIEELVVWIGSVVQNNNENDMRCLVSGTVHFLFPFSIFAEHNTSFPLSIFAEHNTCTIGDRAL